MARITSQKAALRFGGLFDLVLGASQRARELKNGSTPKIKTDNGPIVTALKEIEEGLYTKEDYLKKLPRKDKGKWE
jgi:DNA-directed RNA polymerase omega subunit